MVSPEVTGLQPTEPLTCDNKNIMQSYYFAVVSLRTKMNGSVIAIESV